MPTQEEIDFQNLWNRFEKLFKDANADSWTKETNVCMIICQDYSDQQNSSLIKEVEELKAKVTMQSDYCKNKILQLNALYENAMFQLHLKESEISQLKEANNKLNYAMIEWDTTHPIEAENRELQRKIKELKEALERILKKLPDEDNLDYDPGDIINCIYEIASSATH